MAIASARLGVTLGATSPFPASPPTIRSPPADALDVAAVSRRVAYLDSREVRLEAAIGETQVFSSGTSRSPASPHMLELEQDLRHTREERAWLERIVSHASKP